MVMMMILLFLCIMCIFMHATYLGNDQNNVTCSSSGQGWARRPNITGYFIGCVWNTDGNKG